MKFNYIAAANNTTAAVTLSDGSTLNTAGQPLGGTEKDIFIKKLIIGAPVATANITIFNKSTAFATDTNSIAFKATVGATISSSYTNAVSDQVVYDFTGIGNPGLQLDGGNVMCDQACQITVIWEFTDQEN